MKKIMNEKQLKGIVNELSINLQKLAEEYDCYITMNSNHGKDAAATIQMNDSSEFINFFDGRELEY